MEKKNIYVWHQLGKGLREVCRKACFGLVTGVFLSSGALFAQSDLVLNDVDGATALIKGTTANLSLNVGNEGNTEVANAQVKFTIISIDERNDNYRREIGTLSLPSISAGANASVSASVQVPSDIIANRYRLEVNIVNAGDATPDNNVLYREVSVTGALANLKPFTADYYMGGEAQPLLKDGKPCDCIELTQPKNNESGRAYSYDRLDLRKDQILEFAFYLGLRDGNGADGIVLAIHNDPRGNAAHGGFGEGLGYGDAHGISGVLPSVGIELDTWKNGNRQDPSADHVAFLENGILNHDSNPDLPLVEVPNMEDGKERLMRMEWNASAKTITVYWDKDADGVLNESDLMYRIEKDLPKMLGTDFPFWGVTAATGGAYNHQYFCNKSGKLIYAPKPTCGVAVDDKAASPNNTFNFWWNVNNRPAEDWKNTVEVNLDNAQDDVDYHWVMTFPYDESGQAKTIEGSGKISGNGIQSFEIPYPPADEWGTMSNDGSGRYAAFVELFMNTPCGNYSWTTTYTAPNEVDLSIDKKIPSLVKVGDVFTYTLDVANLGPRNAVEGVTVTDVIPAGFEFVEATGNPTLNGNTLTWNVTQGIGYMKGKTYEITVKALNSGTYNENATVEVANPLDKTPENNTDGAQIVVEGLNPNASLTCSAITIEKAENGTIVLANDNEITATVNYVVFDADNQEMTSGSVSVDAKSSLDFGMKAPNLGRIEFTVPTIQQDGKCFLQNGEITVEAGEREIVWVEYENKVYDAREWFWFVRKEKQILRDRFGATVQDTDKGVSLADLTTIADEKDLFLEVETGKIGYTHALGWCKVVNGMPADPEIIVWKIGGNSSTTAYISEIPANTQIAFFLVATNAKNNPLIQNPNVPVRFVGKTLQYQVNGTWTNVPSQYFVSTIKEWHRKGLEQAIGGIEYREDKAVLRVGFEDIEGGGDRDYEDHVVTIHMKGVENLQTKVIKETKTVPNYVEVPCGDCVTNIEGSAAECTPVYVPTSYKVGELQNKIEAWRKDPQMAVTVDESTKPKKFTTLGGIGGEITLDFQGPQKIVLGKPDIRVHEATWGKTPAQWNSYPEIAEVWVSQDGANFFKADNPAKIVYTDITLDGTGLTWFRYVKIVDITPKGYVKNGDGFDVNYISCLNGGDENMCSVEVPTGLHVTDVKPCCVYVAWDAVANANAYKVGYKDAGSHKWHFMTTTETNFRVQGLPGMAYEIKVSALCENGESEFSEIVTAVSLGELACDMPTNPRASNVTYNSATVNVDASRNAVGGYEIIFRRANTNDEWLSMHSNNTTFNLGGLYKGYQYEYQVKAICEEDGSLYSAWTEKAYFETCPENEPFCDACAYPVDITATNVTIHNATISWAQVGDIQDYEIEYRFDGATRWIRRIVTGTEIELVDLFGGVKYQARVRTKCTVTKASVWKTINFETEPDPSCHPIGNIGVSDRIENIQDIASTVTTIHWSGDNSGNTHYAVRYRKVGETKTHHFTAFTNSLDIHGLTEGQYQFWVRNMNCPSGGWKGITWTLVDVFACDIPQVTGFEAQDPFNVTASWTKALGAYSYIAEYRPKTAQYWHVYPAQDTTLAMSDLFSGTPYQFRVKSVCKDPWVSNYAYGEFETDGNNTCPDVTNVQFQSLLPFCMTATWEETAGGAIEYQVQFLKEGDKTWSTRYVTQNSITLTGLEAGENYQFRVRAICRKNANGQIALASNFLTEQFTAVGEDELNQGGYIFLNTTGDMGIAAYPNPFADELKMRFVLDRAIKLRVYNVLGSLVYERGLDGADSFTMNTSNMDKGLYIIHVVSEDGTITP